MPQPFGNVGGALLRGLVPLGLIWAWAEGCICAASAQEVRESLAGEKAAQEAKKREIVQGYNLHWGPFSFQVESSLHARFTDNVFSSSVDRRSDEILRPEVKLDSYWPITDVNALTLSLGVNYEYFVNNTQLNTDSPLISPDSAIELLLYVKDFRFRFHERFSYQESLYYGSGYFQQAGQFINLVNLGTFGRIDNLAGFNADWDLSDVILSLGYDHENFISTFSALDYLSRASDLLSASAALILGPRLRSGLESKATWNVYDTHQLPSHWRGRVGPFVEFGPGDYVRLGAGGGCESVLIPRFAGLTTDSSPYYAYFRATHTVNEWLSYTFSAAHENQLGWITANAETTSLGLSAPLKCLDRVEVIPGFAYGLGKESGPSYAGSLRCENYSYFQASLGLVYHLGERWAADLRYDYIQKDSNLPNQGYFRNVFNVGITYRF